MDLIIRAQVADLGAGVYQGIGQPPVTHTWFRHRDSLPPALAASVRWLETQAGQVYLTDVAQARRLVRACAAAGLGDLALLEVVTPPASPQVGTELLGYDVAAFGTDSLIPLSAPSPSAVHRLDFLTDWYLAQPRTASGLFSTAAAADRYLEGIGRRVSINMPGWLEEILERAEVLALYRVAL